MKNQKNYIKLFLCFFMMVFCFSVNAVQADVQDAIAIRTTDTVKKYLTIEQKKILANVAEWDTFSPEDPIEMFTDTSVIFYDRANMSMDCIAEVDINLIKAEKKADGTLQLEMVRGFQYACPEINDYFLGEDNWNNKLFSDGFKGHERLIPMVKARAPYYQPGFPVGELGRDMREAGIAYDFILFRVFYFPNGYLEPGDAPVQYRFYDFIFAPASYHGAFTLLNEPEHIHTYSSAWTVDKKATFTEDGSKSRHCTHPSCSEKYRVTVIPKISSVTLSASAFPYTGIAIKPTVTVKNSKGTVLKKDTDYTLSYSSGRKNVGTYTVKVTLKGAYKGSKTFSFKINPKSTAISKLTAASKGFTVTWKKQATQTKGYQIQYSTSSKFTNAKTVTVTSNTTLSKKITKLTAKKKYYVRVRTYQTVGTTKYYSSWSPAKYVTTK